MATMMAFAAIGSAGAAEFGRLVKLAGDRQIVVGPFPSKGQPFSVKILSAQDQPLPGIAVHIQATQGANPDLELPRFRGRFSAWFSSEFSGDLQGALGG